MSSTKHFSECRTVDEYFAFKKLADYQARCFVNPMRKHGKSGKWEPVGYEFADRFLVHPWVRESVTEGWDKELRGVLIAEVRRRIIHGESYGIIEELMPPKKWVDDAKHFAARCRKATDWQNQHMPRGLDFSKMLRIVPNEKDDE